MSGALKKLCQTILWLKEEHFYRLNERAISGEYFRQLTFCKRQAGAADACRNTEEEKTTLREERAIETLTNNPFVKERVFYCLNDQFVSNKTGDIIYSTWVFGTLQTINSLQASCRHQGV